MLHMAGDQSGTDAFPDNGLSSQIGNELSTAPIGPGCAGGCITCCGPPVPEGQWPAQVDLVMSALDAGQYRQDAPDRRSAARKPLRVCAVLRLFSDPPGTVPWKLYTRDVHARGLGFITPHQLPLGHGGKIEIPGEGGEIREVACTLLRCRQAAPGWYEGSLYFNRLQSCFAV